MVKTLPVLADLSRPYREAARKGTLLLQRCVTCGQHQFYPRPLCLACSGSDLDWIEAARTGALHTDESFVREHTPFRGRIAHGLLVLAMASGLRSELDRVQSVAFLEVRREFVAPTYPGDTIHARWTVEEARPSTSRPGTGVVRLRVEVVNQAGEVVQRGTDLWLVAARPTTPPDGRHARREG